MNYITPHQYLRDLKELLEIEKAKIKEQKNMVAKCFRQSRNKCF